MPNSDSLVISAATLSKFLAIILLLGGVRLYTKQFKYTGFSYIIAETIAMDRYEKGVVIKF